MKNTNEELDNALLEKLVDINNQIRSQEIADNLKIGAGCLMITVKLAVYAAIIGIAIKLIF